MKNRILSLLLCMVLLVSALPQMAFAASSVVAKGKCGDNVHWELDKSGTLTLSGFDDMDDWGSIEFKSPWYEYRNDIKFVKIGKNITSIGSYAFYECANLSSVLIPNSVKKIENAAFSNCSGLKYIIFGSAGTKLGEDVFEKCPNITILCSKNSSVYKYANEKGIKCRAYEHFSSSNVIDGYVIDDKKTLYVINNDLMHDFGVENRIGAGSAVPPAPWNKHKDQIREVIVFDGVPQIGNASFYDCASLNAVTIPESVTRIGEEAFYNCYSLKSITIPASVKNIETSAFNRCPTTIVCYENSAAHKFALNNGMDYEFIDEDVNVDVKPEKNPPAKENMNFSDVPSNAWYYSDLKAAFDAGIINGKTASEFKPNDNMTYAEAIKLAACLHQKVTTGKVTLVNGNPWYQTYVDYCKANGIINRDYNYNAPASRAGYMMIFANALPNAKLAAMNKIDDNAIPDVKVSDAYGSGVYKLYRAGVVGGSDTAHNCKPNDNIKRAEVATILARMMFPEKRITFTLEMAEAVQPTGMRLDYNKTTLSVGEVDYWAATVYPDDAVTALTWSSSDTSVATVDQNGKVTAIAPGEARISVITENGIKEAITVTVIK